MERNIFNVKEIDEVAITATNKINTPEHGIMISFTGQGINNRIIINNANEKHIDLVELTILNVLNDKQFFSFQKLELNIRERLKQAEKKDKEYDEKD